MGYDKLLSHERYVTVKEKFTTKYWTAFSKLH
jgi:hypothetical protein